MAEQDRRNWIVVGVLFVTMFLIWGPVNASGVFFLPVITHFGWSRTLFSSMVATAPLAAGISGPLLGRMLDRVGARNVMMVGAAMVALGDLGLSRANSPAALLCCFVVLGTGISASTIIPAALVITRSFQERRGLALARHRVRGNPAGWHRDYDFRELRGSSLWLPCRISRDSDADHADRTSLDVRISSDSCGQRV
jgi:MFS family permease